MNFRLDKLLLLEGGFNVPGARPLLIVPAVPEKVTRHRHDCRNIFREKFQTGSFLDKFVQLLDILFIPIIYVAGCCLNFKRNDFHLKCCNVPLKMLIFLCFPFIGTVQLCHSWTGKLEQCDLLVGAVHHYAVRLQRGNSPASEGKQT